MTFDEWIKTVASHECLSKMELTLMRMAFLAGGLAAMREHQQSLERIGARISA